MVPIILIPGLVCTAELFASQVGTLWTRGPVTVASTLDGETMGDLAAAILADAPPRFALAGLSMGGYVALEIMRRAPDRVVRLALLDTAASPDTPEQSEARRAAIARVEAGELEAVLREMAPRLLHPDHQTDATLIDAQMRMGLAVGAKAYIRQQSAIIGRIDSRPHLAGITVPTWIVVGDQDAVTPPDRAQEMASAIPEARLGIVEGAGHLTPLEQADAIERLLMEWLSH
jgi:pimeloyl-ACP methyl ester carboxylesterase